MITKRALIITLLIATIITSIASASIYESYIISNKVGYATTGPVYTLSNGTFQALNKIPSYVSTNANNNTVYISSNDPTTVVEASPVWYNSMNEFFLIYNMTNPTIVVHSGTTLHIIFINMDRMTHNLAIVSFGPPYAYMPSMGYNNGGGMMGNGGNMMSGVIINTPMINGITSSNSYIYNALNLTCQFNHTGILWYICTYPGHAEAGMYGKIIVK